MASPKKNKPVDLYRKKINTNPHLLGSRWDGNTWDYWDTKFSVKDRQAHFDARIGNIYIDWEFHYGDPAYTSMWFTHKTDIGDGPCGVNSPHMLIGAKITRDNYNLHLLHIKSGKTFWLRHKEYNHWWAERFRGK